MPLNNCSGKLIDGRELFFHVPCWLGNHSSECDNLGTAFLSIMKFRSFSLKTGVDGVSSQLRINEPKINEWHVNIWGFWALDVGVWALKGTIMGSTPDESLHAARRNRRISGFSSNINSFKFIKQLSIVKSHLTLWIAKHYKNNIQNSPKHLQYRPDFQSCRGLTILLLAPVLLVFVLKINFFKAVW